MFRNIRSLPDLHIHSDRFNIDRLTADVRTNFPVCLTRTWSILICNISTNIVGIATHNGMDRPQIESSGQNPRIIQPTWQEVPGSFPGVNQQERGAAHPPSFSVEVLNGLETACLLRPAGLVGELPLVGVLPPSPLYVSAIILQPESIHLSLPGR